MLIGNTDVEDTLQRLNDLTEEEAQIASAEILKTTNSLGGSIQGVERGVEVIVDELQGVQGNLESVDEGVQDVLDTVQDLNVELGGVSHGVQEINRDVQSVRDRMDFADRQHFSTLLPLLLYLISPHRKPHQ